MERAESMIFATNKIVANNETNIVRLSSVEVSEMMDTQHKTLLAKIDNINKVFNEQKIMPVKYWVEGDYVDSKGEYRRCYYITKEGCEFLSHKSTGNKGIIFTHKYMERFKEMENRVKKPRYNLSKELQAIFLIDEKQQLIEQNIQEVKTELTDFKKDIPLFAIECDEISRLVRKIGTKSLNGKMSKAYKDKSLRSKVYSDIYRQLRREFGVTSYKAIKRRQMQQALEVVENYRLPVFLEEEINLINGIGGDLLC